MKKNRFQLLFAELNIKIKNSVNLINIVFGLHGILLNVATDASFLMGIKKSASSLKIAIILMKNLNVVLHHVVQA